MPLAESGGSVAAIAADLLHDPARPEKAEFVRTDAVLLVAGYVTVICALGPFAVEPLGNSVLSSCRNHSPFLRRVGIELQGSPIFDRGSLRLLDRTSGGLFGGLRISRHDHGNGDEQSFDLMIQTTIFGLLALFARN